MNLVFTELQTPESLQIIREIAADIWPKTFAEILSSEQISYMMDMMYSPEVMEKELSENMHFNLLEIDGEAAGYVVYSAYNETPETAKLHKLYLKEKFHSCGIGQQMLNYVQESCRTIGFKRIILAVNKQNTRAIKAYKRNGFTTYKAVCNPIGNGFFMDDYLMQKPL